MKRLLSVLAVAGILAFTGCDNKSSSGGPGATNSGKGAHLSQPEQTFKLSMPTFSTTIKQGESKDVKIGINRGTNFDQDVALKFEDVPKGLTIDAASAVIKHGDKEINVKLKAADDAAVGDHTIKVKGHPEKGPDAGDVLKVKIDKK
jgi:uncharacterized membrane protein